MIIFIEILKLIAVSLAPGAVALLIYIAKKKIKYIKKINPIIRDIIIGLIFAVTTMLPFYCGMNYMNIFRFEYKILHCFGPILASPIIATFIFGWVSGATTAFAAGIWRFFAVSLTAKDYLRIGDTVTIFLAVLLSIIIIRYVVKKMTTPTPKWTYGIVVGLIIECVHILITFPIIYLKYNDIDFAHQIINETDYILVLSTIVSLTLAFLWLNLYNKQDIRIFRKETKLHANIQRRVGLFFVIAFAITYVTTSVISIQKSLYDIGSDLMVSTQDVVNEVYDTSDEFGFSYLNVMREIASNRRIRTNGFVVIASAKDQDLYKPENTINDIPKVATEKNWIVAMPKRLSVDYMLQPLYFNNNPSDVCENHLDRTVTFTDKLDKKITCRCSKMFLTKVYDYKNGNGLVDYLTQIIRTGPVKGGDTNDYYVASFITLEEATDGIVLSIRISMYFEILIYSLIYLLIHRLIRRKVADNIDDVNGSLTKISAGNLNTKVNVREFDEFVSLSDDINQTVDVLKHYIDDANKRIDDELKYAKAIQMSAIPLMFPVNPNIDLYASMVTAKQVGGDFYDFFFIDDNHIFFMVADVSGKGIPAAMFMMRAKTLINALSQTKELELNTIVDNVNDELNNDNKSGMFVTAFGAVLNIKTGKLEYVNAGHTRPLIKDKNGNTHYLTMKPNLVLGVFPGYQYSLETIYLKPGDQIILYTDGVTEATNKKKQLYGESRLIKFANKKSYKGSIDFIDSLNKELMKYQKGVEQADDITILSVIYKPNKK